MAEMVRVNTRISAELNRWLDEESERTGVPKSTLIHLALTTYMQQQRAIGSLEEIIKRLDRLEIQGKAKEAVAEPPGDVVANP